MSLLNLCLARRRKAKTTEDYKGRQNTRVNNKIIESAWAMRLQMESSWNELESLHGMKKGRHYD